MATVDLVSRLDCTGCHACGIVCPVAAIRFVKDGEGFFVPKIETSVCIGCGRCVKACPVNNDFTKDVASEAYLVRLKDRKVLKRSASGGAFVGLARFLLKNPSSAVVGASLCDDLVVRHIMVGCEKELHRLQNSKYVQSDVGNIYNEVRERLNAGSTVLFSGTPCQVAGLIGTLAETETRNLFTVDVVCHGVPSPAFLERQLKEESSSNHGGVKSYRFRFKNPLFESTSSYFMIMEMERGLPVVRRVAQDPYFNLFVVGLSLRESCYRCRFSGLRRVGDFSIGDCDSHHHYPGFFPNESNSILLVNSEKARKLWDSGLSSVFHFTRLDLELEAVYNRALSRPVHRPNERDFIYKELLNADWNLVKSKYSERQPKGDRLKLLLLMHVPQRLVRLLSNILRRKRK